MTAFFHKIFVHYTTPDSFCQGVFENYFEIRDFFGNRVYPIKNIEKKKTESEKEALYGRGDRKDGRHMTYEKLYAKEYLGTVFYYCLRRTGSEEEAQELASDISIAVLQGLSRGTVPERFSAYVWRIAKNRYARWAEKKRRHRELFADEDWDELHELADECGSACDAMVERETLAALRRELTLIRSDYRRVLVAFYIDDKKISQIADELSLPLGTVKTRLVKARKILKEGMDMAREFGKLSYRPENVAFVNTVPKPGRNGEPWSLFKRLLPKNILLAAYRNPMTAEELSLELGVALPYLEEEIAVLESELLLQKSGKRYETMITILSADAQRRIYDKISAITPALTKKIEEYLTLRDELYAENGLRWNLGAQSPADMRWARLMRAVDNAFCSISDGESHTVRPDGGEWDIVGYEEYDGLGFIPVGQNGSYQSKAYFSQYKFVYQDLHRKTPEDFPKNLADALEAVCEGRDADGASVAELCRMGYLKEENGAYIPQMMAVDARYGDIGTKGLPEKDEKTLLTIWNDILDFAREIKAFCAKTVTEEMPAYLKDRAEEVERAADRSWEVRGAVLEAALADGYLSYAENDPRFLLGTMITVNREK